MPRRKQSRVPSRAPPVLPDISITEPDMEAEHRKEKLRLLLADFDHEVQRQVRMMEDEIEVILQSMRQLYRTDLMRYPAAIRNLPWQESGKQESVLARNSMTSVINSAENMLQSVAKKRGRKPKALLLLQENDMLAPPPTLSSSTRSTRQRAVLGSSQSDNMLPPTTTARLQHSRKVDKAAATPINQGVPQQYLSSLFVTPKFDPHTPLPPGTIKRKPRVGEIAISLTGSPLQVSPIINPRVGMDGWLAMVNAENMDEETKAQLINIQDKVSKMLNV